MSDPVTDGVRFDTFGEVNDEDVVQVARWADFPSDEDVEVAAKALWDNGAPMESGTAYPRRMARAALHAVADARRTEEEGT